MLRIFLFCRDNLDPVSIRIFDEINAHICVFKADTAHVLVSFQRSFVVVYAKRQMELIIPKVIWAFPFLQPSELQLMACLIIAQIDDNKAAIRRFVPLFFL